MYREGLFNRVRKIDTFVRKSLKAAVKLDTGGHFCVYMRAYPQWSHTSTHCHTDLQGQTADCTSLAVTVVVPSARLAVRSNSAPYRRQFMIAINGMWAQLSCGTWK